jgi:hypothetical protein
MAVTHDPPVFRNGWAVSALARVMLRPMGLADGVAIAGSKHPLAVLLHDGTSLRAFDLVGHPMSLAAVEALHPGAARTLAAAWHDHHDAAPAGFSGDRD